MVTRNSQNQRWRFLLLSILLDFFSVLSFGAPWIGELLDLIWAPISAYLLNKMYSNRALSRIQFWKEILPFTDIIPVASLSWCIEYTDIGRAFARAFGITKSKAPTRPE